MIVRLYRFSRLDRMDEAPSLSLFAGSSSSVSGTEGGRVVGMGGDRGISEIDGIRGV